MRKFLPLIFFFVIVIFFFRQVLFQGLLPIPADDLVGLFFPFRDFYARDYPNGIPFKNFLITDSIVQTYPWRYLAISVEKHFQLPLWNPYNLSGTPLLGNFQAAPFYPLNILFFILPFITAWNLLIILELILGGIFLYFYLKNLKIHPLAAILSCVAFAFCGFSVSWLEWNTILQVAIWLPLILLAKDKLLSKWSFRWGFIFIFAECAAVFAGHLQILFYSMILTNLYLFVRIFWKVKTENKKQAFLVPFIKTYAPFLIAGVVMFMITAIQTLPTIQFILLSSRSLDQSWHIAGWFIPWQNLAQFIAPDIFGNPATLNYFGTWNYGELVGYIGIVPLIFSFYAVLFRRDKKTLFFSLIILLCLIFALPTPIAKLPFILRIPLISTSQPTRLMFLIDFSLIILSGLGFDLFINSKIKKKIFFPMFLVSLSFLILILIAKFNPIIIGIEPKNSLISVHNFYFQVAILISSIIVFVIYSIVNNSKLKIVVYFLLILITAVDLLRFANKFTPFTNPAYLYPNTKVTKFLQQNLGNYRYITTDSNIMPPNVSIMYKLQTIDGYDPLMTLRYEEFISASDRNYPNINPPFGFNRILTSHNFKSKIMDLLGAKYVLTFNEIKDKGFHEVAREGITKVYENMNALPRAFFVDSVIFSTDKQDEINKIFDSNVNLRKTAIVELNKNIKSENLSGGNAEIYSYSENKVKIQTENNNNGFLVLTDVYYPTWKVTIDGKKAQILETDFALRGVFVPKGNHLIEFSDHLF